MQVEEQINAIRKLWYEENEKDTTFYDARQIGMHVGIKTGLIKAMNALRELEKEAHTPNEKEAH
jgi:hypothetical protein